MCMAVGSSLSITSHKNLCQRNNSLSGEFSLFKCLYIWFSFWWRLRGNEGKWLCLKNVTENKYLVIICELVMGNAAETIHTWSVLANPRHQPLSTCSQTDSCFRYESRFTFTVLLEHGRQEVQESVKRTVVTIVGA